VPALAGKKVSVLIWTTTPWTIPSNLGIAFHPDFVYGAYDVDGKAVIIAKDLAEAVGKKTGKSFDRPIATFEGRQMERLVFRHPLYSRDSLGVLGDYVTLEAGTGAVTPRPDTAPTTTRPASATASRSMRRSIPAATSTSRSRCSPGSRSPTRTRRSKRH
jgi:isoleucyl-tRNA synthetase